MRIYPVFIPHSGCPHRCLFCAQDKTSGQTEAPTPDSVKVWLDQTLPLVGNSDGSGDGEIAFYGGTFTALPQSTQDAYLDVAKRFVAAGRVGAIRLSTRPETLDAETVERLCAFGVATVEIGAQSFDSQVLLAAKRGHSAADVIAAVQQCRAAKLQVGLQLMPGLPAGNAKEALASLDSALALQPDFVRIYPALVVEGTGLALLWRDGAYRPWSLDEAVEVCADMMLACRRSHVPVIRLGLQQEASLEQNLLSGPYHPAFGQLVRSRLWRRALGRAANSGMITVHPDDYSDVIGHGGENRRWLERRYPQLKLQRDSAIERDSLLAADGAIDLYDPTSSRQFV